MLRLWRRVAGSNPVYIRAVGVEDIPTALVPAVAAQGHPTYRDLTRLDRVSYRNLCATSRGATLGSGVTFPYLPYSCMTYAAVQL